MESYPGKQPRGRQGEKPVGRGVRGVPLASPGPLAGILPPNPLGSQAQGQQPPREQAGDWEGREVDLGGKRSRLKAPELMGPDPVWDVRAPESFPGYSSTAQTSRFWGGNLFSKFLDLSSPPPQAG